MASIYEELLKKRQADLDAKNESTPTDSRAEFLTNYITNRQKQEESFERGRQLVEAQKARDTINKAASNTAATYDFAHGQLPSISNAQAFQNAQRQTSLDDTLNQIMGNNVLTDAGRVSKAQEAYSGILSAPTVSAPPTAQEVANAYRQSYANFNTPMQKAVQAVDAYKTEREQQNLERNRDVGSQRRIHEIRNRLSQEKDRQENAQKDREEIVNRLAEINRELEADPLHTGLFPELEAEKAELEKRLAENDTLFANGEFDNRINALNSQLDEALKAQYASIPYAPDFAERSQSVRDSTKTERINPLTREEYDRMTPEEQMRYKMDHPWESQVTLSDVLSKNGDPFFDPVDAYSYLEHMTDAQRGTYNYLYNTSGADAANEYLERMRPQFEAQMAQNITERTAEYAENHPVIASAESVLSNIGKAPAAVANIANSVAGNETNPNAWYNRAVTLTDTTRSTVGQKFAENAAKKFSEWGASDEASQFAGNTANFLYGTGMSMIDSMVNAAIGSYVTGASALNPAVNSPEEIKKVAEQAATFTRTLMALEATPSALIEAKERGLSDTQAMTIGLIAGAAEYVTEKWSVENLFSADWEENTLKNLIKQVVSESSEEGASNIINLFADILVAGDKSDWQKSVNEYKSTGDNDKQAFWHTMRDKAIDLGVDMLGGAISGGGMGVGRVVGGAVNNAQYRVHNQMRTEGQKQGGVDYLGDMTRLAENAMNLATDSAEQIEALHELNDEMERFYPKDTTKRTIDFLVEGAKIAQANGDAETATNYKLLEQTVRNNQQTFTDRLNQNRQAAQQTAQTETAEQTPAPSITPSTAEAAPSTELSTDSTTPSIQATNPEIQATIAQNQATTQAETAQTVSDARQVAQNEANAVQTGKNAVEKNAAQNGSVNATEHNANRTYENALNLQQNLSNEDIAKTLIRRAIRNAAADDTVSDLRSQGIAKTVTDAQVGILNQLRNSGEYSAEEIQQIADKMKAVDKEAAAISRGEVQKYANALTAGLKKFGVQKVVVDESLTNNYETGVKADRGFYDPNTKTVHLSALLDTEEAVAGVIAHEVFHDAERGDERTALLDSVLKARDTILSGSGVSETGRAVIDNIPIESYIKAYGPDLIRTFGLTNDGQEVVNAFLAENPGIRSRAELMKQLYERDGEKFWDYFNTKDNDNARDYIREEMAAHFIEQLGGSNGNAIMRELLRDNRNALQKFIDGVRKVLNLPERQISDKQAYRNLVNAYERAVAEEAGTEAREASRAATPNDIPKSDSFKMARTVERVGDLIAVHNLTEDKYLSTHKLGGFPAPSIAIVKAKTGHDDYGPISVVFGSDTIDPQKDSRNRIFGGDAWTPMFPDVKYDYKVSGVENLEQAIYKLAQRSGGYGKNLASPGGIRSLFDGIMQWGDSPETALDTLGLRRDVQAAYLAAQGEKLKANDKFAAFAELDKRAPADKVKAWLRPAIEQIAGEGALDVAGERVPLTAENVVRAMYENRGSRGIDIYEADANGLRSMAAPEYQSIDEVRQNRDKLKRLDDKEYQKIVSRLDGYIDSIKDEIEEFNGGRNSLEYDKTILDALREGGTEEDIRYAFEEAGIGINNKLVRDVGVLYKLASQLPTDYFEAKPERVVGFDEVMYYIIPNDIAPSTAEMMENDGATVLGYTAGDEKERLKVLNSLKDVRFSREINAEQTETEAFKKWFGDWQNNPEDASKIVNGDGTPKIMYRGDSENFTVFDRKKSRGSNLYGRGFYFTDSETHAGQYGAPKAYYLDVKNPLTPGQNSITREQMQAFLEAVQENEDDYDFMNYGQNAMVESVLDDMWGKGDFEMLQDVNSTAIGDLVAAIELFNEVNGTDYDGIVTPTETVVFNSNQIKSATDNIGTFDRNNPDVRYSRELESIPESDSFRMAREVERVGELVAVHNLTEDQLVSSLELGGFAAPSIAVVKAATGHSKYGPVSVVFGASRIDPSVNRLNRIYGGDAYTPVFPEVGYQIDAKTLKNIQKRIDKILGDDSKYLSVNLDADNVSDNIRRNKGSFADAYANNNTAKYAFLKDTGRLDTVPTKERNYSSTLTNDALRRFNEQFDSDALMESGYQAVMEHEPEIRKFLYDEYMNQTGNQRIADKLYGDKALDYSKISNIIYAARQIANNGVVQEQDTGKMRTAINDEFNKDGVQEEFERWLNELSEGIVAKKGIRNNKDYFTPSGNRRSFNQLYDDYTLQNIVKAMYSGNSRGVDTIGVSANAIQSVATPSYKNLDEVRKDSSRLGAVSAEEYQHIQDRINDRINATLEQIYNTTKHYSDNRFVEYDSIAEAMVNAARGAKTANSIKQSMTRDGYNISQSIAEDLRDIYKEAITLPTEYFEAKPERVVYTSEIANVIVPDNIRQSTKDALDRERVKYIEYESGNEEDRLAKLNSLEDVRFSREITPEQDAEYMEAVESGDTDKQQRMVDDAAKEAGYKMALFHGTGEYFNIFRRGGEGIHLGNRDVAEQVARSRYSNRSKETEYKWNDIQRDLDSLDATARRSLADKVYVLQDYFDGSNEFPYEGDLMDTESLRNYLDTIMNRYKEAYRDDNPTLRMATYDRQVGERVMNLYAKINNPMVVNGDLTEWTPYRIASMILAKAEGQDTLNMLYADGIDLTGFDADLTDAQKNLLRSVMDNYSKDTEELRWDILAKVIGEMGYDSIQYLNQYEGDKNNWSYIALRPSDVKSADPVTYDIKGNPIPLSERFNPENEDIRYSREIESETERKLRREREKSEYLQKQLTRYTAFGDAKVLNPSAREETIAYYSRMFKGDIPRSKIESDLKGFWEIMERPKKGQSDTAESRWAEAQEYARKIAHEWAEATTYDRVFKEEIGDENMVDALRDFRSLLMGRSGITNGEGEKVSSPGYYYIIPDMIAEAGDKESFNRLRKSLHGMKLKGFNTLAEAQASGRTSIDQLYQEVSQDGNAYNSLFESEGELSSGEMNGDFAKLSKIAEVADLAWEAVNDPYTYREFGEDAVDAQTEMLMNDFINRWNEKARPTRMSQTYSENDMKRAAAEGEAGVGAIAENAREEGYQAGREEGYRQGQFENASEVGAAQMREEMMAQRFAEDAERLRRNYERMKADDERKISRLEDRIAQHSQTEAAKLARNHLLRNLNRLNNLLESPTKNHHVPQALRANVARFLENISQTDTRLLNGKTISAERMQEIQAQEAEAIKNLASDLVGGLNGVESAADNSTIRLTSDFLDQLTDKVKWLNDIYGRMQNPQTEYRNRIDDLAVTRNVEYLKQMNKIVDMVVHALNEQNAYIIDGKYRDASELSARLSNDLDGKASRATGLQKKELKTLTSDKLRGMAYEFMSADLFFSEMGENWTDIIAHSYRQGQNRQAKHEARYVDYMKKLNENYKVREAGNAGELLTLNINGDDVTMTRGQLMHLYALWNRPAGRQHLENGGACFLNEKGEEYRENTKTINAETAERLFSNLTEQEKAIADGMVKFMADECGEWGNEASMYMYGYRMYEDPHYVPLDVVDYILPKDLGSKKGTRSIEHASFTNSLKRDASAPLRISNLYDVTDDHVRRMAAYNAYAPITNDMNRILQMPGMNEKIQNRMGKRGMKYLTDFVETVAANEVRSGEMAESAAPLNFLMNAYKRQAVAWNVSTMLKQPISIFRAANEIDGKYLWNAVKLDKGEYQRIKADMENNSGVAYIKSNGYSDVGFGSTLRKLYSDDYINEAGIIRGALSSTKAGAQAIKAYDAFIEKGMEGAGRADETTWVRIWKACELEVADKYPNLTANEFTKKVAERFNDVIGKTQVVDTVLDTAPLMRNKAMQIFTPFMNEPTKSLGGLIVAADAIRDGKAGAKKAFGKAVGLYAISNLLIEPIITSLMTMWRDEKDDTDRLLWSFLEKMFGISEEGATAQSVLTSNVVSGLFSFPVLNIFYDTISNALQGYGSDKIDVAALSDFVDASKNLYNGMMKDSSDRTKTMYRLWGDWAESLAATIGVPARTIRRQIAGTARLAIDATNANMLKWEYNKLYYNLDNSSARSQKNFYDIMAAAYKDGDTEAYQRMRSELNEIVNSSGTLVKPSSITDAIEKRGGEIAVGTELWNLDVQARFRLEAPVKGWKVENTLTSVYKQAEKAGIDNKGVLLSMPDAPELTDENGDKVKMNAADYDVYTRDVGALSYKTIAELSSGSNSEAWSKLTVAQKVDAIEKVYKYTKAKYKKDYSSDYNIRSQGVWMDELYDSGNGSKPSAIAAAAIKSASEKK